MNILLLILIYIVGVTGYCWFSYIGRKMMLNSSLYLSGVNWKIVVPVGIIALPIILLCMYITTLDALLWINRELSLNISCFEGMYGPMNEILR